ASLILMLVVWQPFKSSNDEIFSTYTSGSFNIPSVKAPSSNNNVRDNNLRGSEFAFNGYTKIETEEILASIDLIKAKEFSAAEDKLAALLKPHETNPDLILYLAIAKLNSSKEFEAVSKLEKLAKVPNYHNEAD